MSPTDGNNSEHPETVPIWPVLPLPPPVALRNKYGLLTDFEHNDADESDVVKAWAAITPNVSRASDDLSQKARKA